MRDTAEELLLPARAGLFIEITSVTRKRGLCFLPLHWGFLVPLLKMTG